MPRYAHSAALGRVFRWGGVFFAGQMFINGRGRCHDKNYALALRAGSAGGPCQGRRQTAAQRCNLRMANPDHPVKEYGFALKDLFDGRVDLSLVQ